MESRLRRGGMPQFTLQYRVSLGTCAGQTTVMATLADGSALPAYVSYAYANGLLEVAGTLPLGSEPLSVVAVAQLGAESFRSVAATVTPPCRVACGWLRQRRRTMRACPYVSVVFRVTRQSTCGHFGRLPHRVMARSYHRSLRTRWR